MAYTPIQHCTRSIASSTPHTASYPAGIWYTRLVLSFFFLASTVFFSMASSIGIISNATAAPAKTSRVVTVTLPFSQGNEIDVFFKLLQAPLSKASGQPVQFIYKPGRGGPDAWATVDQKNNKGNVLTAIELPGLLLRSMQPDSGLDARDLRICHLSVYSPLTLWVPQNSPYASLSDLVTAIRKKPYSIYIAGPGSYSGAELATLRLNRALGIIALNRPYMGALEAARASSSGKAQAFWSDAVLMSELATGYRALAVAAEERSPVLPGVPTFKELQVDLVEGNYRGVALPATASRENCALIYDRMEEIFASPGLVPTLRSAGFSRVEIPFETIPDFVEKLHQHYADMALNHDLTLR